eukprot:3078454-Pyramimonas_sp.AAC.1
MGLAGPRRPPGWPRRAPVDEPPLLEPKIPPQWQRAPPKTTQNVSKSFPRGGPKRPPHKKNLDSNRGRCTGYEPGR